MPPGLYRAKENGIAPKYSKSHQRSSDVEDSVSSHLPALPGTRQVVSSCGSRNLYPIPRLTFSSQHAHVFVLCVVFLASTFYNSLCPILWFVCFWEGSKDFSVTCMGYEHYSKVSYFQADMGRHSRNWPRLQIKWKKFATVQFLEDSYFSLITWEKHSAGFVRVFNTTWLLALTFNLANKAQQMSLLWFAQCFSKHLF